MVKCKWLLIRSGVSVRAESQTLRKGSKCWTVIGWFRPGWTDYPCLVQHDRGRLLYRVDLGIYDLLAK